MEVSWSILGTSYRPLEYLYKADFKIELILANMRTKFAYIRYNQYSLAFIANTRVEMSIWETTF